MLPTYLGSGEPSSLALHTGMPSKTSVAITQAILILHTSGEPQSISREFLLFFSVCSDCEVWYISPSSEVNEEGLGEEMDTDSLQPVRSFEWLNALTAPFP